MVKVNKKKKTVAKMPVVNKDLVFSSDEDDIKPEVKPEPQPETASPMELPISPEDEAALLDEPIPEWEEDDDENKDSVKTETTAKDDHQKEFQVLGQQTFHDLKKINVTSSWVDSATVFPAEMEKKNLADLESVVGLPEKLATHVAKTISNWFPVQKSVLPILLSAIVRPPVMRPRDVTISAPTGSGKTLCYVLPILASIGERPSGRLSALVVVPVQTLVLQIEEEFARFNACGARVSAFCGSTEFDKEVRKLNGGPTGKCQSDVIITTPGRLLEHLNDPRNTISLDSLRFLVVDEADRMGTKIRAEWLELVERRSGGLTRATNLLDTVSSRQAPRKILLSATLSKDVEELHMWNLHRPCLFRATVTTSQEVQLVMPTIDHVSGRLSLPTTIRHTVLAAEQAVHPLVVHREVEANPDWKRILVFTEEKVSTQRLGQILSILAGDRYKVEHFSADLFGNRRVKVLKRFKSGTTRILICSDVLSRGVDVSDIDCVINYDLPRNDRLFVHRAGRTGRAGKNGVVLSIGAKDPKRTFLTMLRKTGLWMEGNEERLVTEEELAPHMDEYTKALATVQKSVEKGKTENGGSTNGGKNGKGRSGGPQKPVSGFEFRRHRTWIPGLKEKRDAEKEEKRAHWKKKTKQNDEIALKGGY